MAAALSINTPSVILLNISPEIFAQQPKAEEMIKNKMLKKPIAPRKNAIFASVYFMISIF